MGLIQLVEGFKKKIAKVSGQKKFCFQIIFRFKTNISTVPQVCLPTCPVDFGLSSPENHLNQFLNIIPPSSPTPPHLPLSLSLPLSSFFLSLSRLVQGKVSVSLEDPNTPLYIKCCARPW